MNDETKQKITTALVTLVGAVMWVFLAYKFLEMLCR